MRPYRKLVGLSLVFLLMQSVLQVMGPLLTRTAVDRYLQPKHGAIPSFPGGLLPDDPWTGISRIGLLYLGVLAGTFVSEFAQMYLMRRLVPLPRSSIVRSRAAARCSVSASSSGVRGVFTRRTPGCAGSK